MTMGFDTGRPVTMAAHGMVCSPHALASQAGRDVLLAGGSAIDAAIATAAALAVIYPHMTSVGGDAFWLIHDAARNKVRYLDGGGRAASRGRIDAFHARGLQQIPFRGILPATVTTPGAVASWCEAHAAYGRLPMQRNLQDAIGHARDGFPITARLSRWIAASVDELKQHPDSARIFLPNGQAPVAGSLLANPDLARTLTALAEGGQAAFYGGDTGRRLAAFSQSHGGFFDEQDLAVQTARWGEPLCGNYRDLTLYQTPAPTQGFTVLQMLKLLKPFELHTKEFMSADLVHLMVQAKQLAYHDRDRWLADPLFADVPMERLLSNAYIDQRRTLMDPSQALPWDKVPSHGSLKGDTVYIGVVDKDGNAVSLIQSLYAIFGSAVVAGDTGVVLQNRGAYFSLDPESPNCLQPGKTPQHTLIASIGFRNDKLWSVMGCMGADGQPQIHLQTYIGMLDHGLDIQEAIEAPRWLSGRFALGEARDTLNIEGRFPASTIDELARRNHVVQRWGPWNELAGHAHGITIDPVSGVRMGGSDPRSDGAAVGH